MKRLWSTLACLGVSRVYITGAEKVEKVYFASHALKPEKFCSELIRGECPFMSFLRAITCSIMNAL